MEEWIVRIVFLILILINGLFIVIYLCSRTNHIPTLDCEYFTDDSSFAKVDYQFDICGNYADLSNNILEFEKFTRDVSGTNTINTKKNYNANSDIQYHLPEEDVLKLPDGIGAYGTFVNKNNKVEYIPWQKTNLYPIYYPSGSLRFAPYTYVPTYEDSVIARISKKSRS